MPEWSGFTSTAPGTGRTLRWPLPRKRPRLPEPPVVGILVGSDSDVERMQPALDELAERGIPHELEVRSAHRTPDAVAEYCKGARERGLKVIVAPLRSSKSVLDGMDALRAIVHMPPGVPVACVGVDNAKNAALLAARILGA